MKLAEGLKWWRSLLGMTLMLTAAGLRGQTLINVDTGQGNKTGGAVVGSGTNSWGKFYPDDGMGGLYANGSLSPLYDDLGTNTGAGMLMYNVDGEGDTSWGDEMFDHYLLATSTNLHIYVTNAPIGFYTVYLYGHGSNDTDISIFDVSSAATFHGRKQTSDDPDWNNMQNWTEDLNYVKYTDVAIPAGANLLIEVLENAGGLAIINGFQLKTNAVPSGDLDGDGLSNLTEINNGLDPWSVDSDFDGINDGQEENTDGTDPADPASLTKKQLTLWSFNDAGTWAGDGSQVPITKANLTSVTGATNGAVEIDSSGGTAAKLIYRRVETNATINATPNNGSLRFLFKPKWSTSGGGPGTLARLIDMGLPSSGTNDGSWTLYVSSNGANVKFVTRSEGLRREHFNASISWTNDQWYEVNLNYTPTNSSFYVDGVSNTVGSGVNGFIKLGDLSVGSDGGDGGVTAPVWTDDPCFNDSATLWEWDDSICDYVAGYWSGTWVADPSQTHPDTYFRDAYDYCWNSIVSENGYWQGDSDGKNHSAQGAFDELVAFNYPLVDENDWDGDGLSNAEENTLGTDPLDEDTDSDGVSDYIETLQGRDPLKGAVADTGGQLNLIVYTPLQP